MQSNVVITNRLITARLIGSRTNNNVMRWLYRFAASSTMIAEPGIEIASTPATTSAALNRMLDSSAGSSCCSQSIGWNIARMPDPSSDEIAMNSTDATNTSAANAMMDDQTAAVRALTGYRSGPPTRPCGTGGES